MDARESRGMVIAALCKLNRQNGKWLVPSQSGVQKHYTVDPEQGTCTCPDHLEAGFTCKHVHAVRFTLKREVGRDGTVTETQTITLTERKSCKQDWPKYDEAQMNEKHRFLKLLHDLCAGLPDYPQPAVGRRHAPLCDQVFAMVFKVYSTIGSRRFACDLKDAHEKGYLSHLMHSVQTCAFLEDQRMTPILHKLITQSSLPLRAVETVFAPDSTGFSTSRFVRWFDEKYGVTRSGHEWVKAHAMCGAKTNVVTAVEILDKHAADSPQFGALVKRTAENFTVKEVPADKAYLSHENLELVHQLGGTAYIPFKSNSVQGEAGSLWEKMYLYYNFRKDGFSKHYHQRSNAESTFSMVKAKFRDHVRSKNEVAMKNEVLCKFLCHNICCLIHSQYELGIEPIFWGEEKPAMQHVQAEVVKPAPGQPEPVPVQDAVVLESSAPSSAYWNCVGA